MSISVMLFILGSTVFRLGVPSIDLQSRYCQYPAVLPSIEGGKACDNIFDKERRNLNRRLFKLFVKFAFGQRVHFSEI